MYSPILGLSSELWNLLRKDLEVFRRGCSRDFARSIRKSRREGAHFAFIVADVRTSFDATITGWRTRRRDEHDVRESDDVSHKSA